MKNTEALSRRKFLQAGLLVTSALATVSVSAPAIAAGPTKASRDPFHGLKMGMASYTYQKFTLDQAIAMTKEAGLKYINLKEMHLPLTSTPEQCAAAKAKIDAAGLTLMGGGVIYMKNNETEVRRDFEYAKNAGMPTIVCSPDVDALDLVEKMAKEYKICVAIHNHGPTDKKYPSPRDVFKLVKDRDPIMGCCMDVGHTVRIGEDPVEVMKDVAPRLYDFHMKDVTIPTGKGVPIEVGQGVIDIVGVFRQFIDMKFTGHIGLEYEIKTSAPQPGVIESEAYMRGVLAAI